MNGFYKLKARLRDEGWFVAWNWAASYQDGWGFLPTYHDEKFNEDGRLVHPETGEELRGSGISSDSVYEKTDDDKVLFNVSQDCDIEIDGETCSACEGWGTDDEGDRCTTCFGLGFVKEGFDAANYDTSIDGFVCETPDTQNYSLFYFSDSKEGVENLKKILPIIKECGCEIVWDGTAEMRPEIQW